MMREEEVSAMILSDFMISPPTPGRAGAVAQFHDAAARALAPTHTRDDDFSLSHDFSSHFMAANMALMSANRRGGSRHEYYRFLPAQVFFDIFLRDSRYRAFHGASRDGRCYQYE